MVFLLFFVKLEHMHECKRKQLEHFFSREVLVEATVVKIGKIHSDSQRHQMLNQEGLYHPVIRICYPGEPEEKKKEIVSTLLTDVHINGEKMDFDHLWIQGDLRSLADETDKVKFIGIVAAYNHDMGKLEKKELWINIPDEQGNTVPRLITPDEYTLEYFKKFNADK